MAKKYFLLISFFCCWPLLGRAELINIGQAELVVWGTAFDAQLPTNRPSWAMTLALTQKLLEARNIPLNVNDLLAVAIKESRIGCDPEAEGVDYWDIDEASGCFQFQGPGEATAWEEMQRIFPKRLGHKKYRQLVPGDRFETSAIMLAYYLDFTKGMFQHRQWRVQRFIDQAADPQADIIIYALAYNRGLWDADLRAILKSQRTACLAAADLTDCVSDVNGLDYASSVSSYSADLAGADNYYDQLINWPDIVYFLERLEPIFPKVDYAQLKTAAREIFREKANAQNKIRFRSEFDAVLEAMMDYWPALPKPGEQINYYY